VILKIDKKNLKVSLKN